MLVSSQHSDVVQYRAFDGNNQSPVLLPPDRHARGRDRHDLSSHQPARRPHNRPIVDAGNHAVEIYPPDIVKRRGVSAYGMAAEIVQATRRDKIEYRFRAPVHLLAVHDRGVRRDGETFVEGLPTSSLRDLRQKLTFVPAGHEYYDRQDPHILTRVAYFYFDPDKLAIDPELGFAETSPAPRLFFENNALWSTALKLMSLVEHPLSANRLYFEALGAVLVHETSVRPSSNLWACRRIVITPAGVSSAPRFCWPIQRYP